MIRSKLTAKAQTTIPIAVRYHLDLVEGDRLGFILEDGYARLVKIAATPREPPPTLLAEWNSDADERAYDGL
jgi:bifunctional DNA-binding transcriptional regulator/antitoxin component of YhaV-PrlF toxin-antitoxin module